MNTVLITIVMVVGKSLNSSKTKTYVIKITIIKIYDNGYTI